MMGGATSTRWSIATPRPAADNTAGLAPMGNGNVRVQVHEKTLTQEMNILSLMNHPTLIQLMAIAIIRLLLHGIIAILNTLMQTRL